MRASRCLAALIGVTGLAAVAACRDDAPSPTAPSGPAPVAAAVAALTFRQVSVGIEHACGVATDGQAWCWGANRYGELGRPPEDFPNTCSTGPCSSRPVAVSGGLRFRRVSAGAQFTCGLTTEDRVFCWGRNDGGQLGTGSTAEGNFTPRQVTGTRTYRQVSAGFGAMACAIATSRAAFCWGSGRLGNGSSKSLVPVKVTGSQAWAQLGVGGGFVCGITTASLAWCWGAANNRGQLGNGTIEPSDTPVRSAQGLSIAQIEAGGAHTCAVLVDGLAYCWGEGLGVGDGRGQRRVLNPTPVAGTRKWANVSAGSLHSCGVTRAGRGLCWGLNGGALGNGSTANRFTPTAVSGGLDFVAISAGFVFSCGVAEGGKAWCWGDNSQGQLGDGTLISGLVPVAVAGP